ncbi:MAG: LCP family protein, partial [Brevefilum sp.]|nr:LCP family protein [Brevefilum sp.]
MSKKVGLLVLMVTVFGVLITAIVIVTWWNRPLGEPLLIPSPTLEPAPSKVQKGLEPDLPAITQTVEKTTIRAMTPTATATITPETTEPTPDEPQPLYILAAGIDSRKPGYQGGLADVIRIVRIDFATPRVTVLTLPRDLWVELPGIKEEYPNLTHGKINTAYSYGTPAMDRYQGEGGGPGLLAHTIAHNYGLVVDHYAVLNMEVFVDIVDALGGIDLYLYRTWDGRADTDDPDLEDWVFEEGEHHMEGDEALRFARIRLNDTEIMRTDNQTAVICAIKDKMLHPSVFGALPNLVKAFLGR